MSLRDLLARESLVHIPHILTLLDRNPHSPTYGCFDRNYWHYKVIDFPSGMSQEFVWPLALAYRYSFPGNRFHGREVIRDWVESGIRFAAKSAHADGSCDDYFPHERAAGAAAFSLLACMESYELVSGEDPALLEFFARRAGWLAHREESGRLSNHQALAVLCLDVAGRLLNSSEWRRAADRRLEQILNWQSAEGWFPEYEGFDPGYQTLTISCLAGVLEMRPDHQRLRDAIVRAVEVTAHFVHSDGSFGGEYGSRNTYNFFPHGFELVGRWHPGALSINDRFLEGLAGGRGAHYADDRLVAHHCWNYMLAWRDYVDERPTTKPAAPGRMELREAGLLVDRRDDTELYVALNKGGTFKCFRDGRLIASDTQVSLQIRKGNSTRCAVGHLVDSYETEITDNSIVVRGSLGWAKQLPMTTGRLLVLRVVMSTIGRWFPDLIRRVLQRVLIVGKSRAPFEFHRRLEWRGDRWHVTDEITGPSWKDVTAGGFLNHQTSIYIAMSRVYEDGQLCGPTDLTPMIRKLADREALVVHRVLGEEPGAC